MSTPSALHSKKTPKWGTSKEIIALATTLLDGHIDLDPASSPEFNLLVQALKIYTEHDSGLTKIWAGTVFLNPPGGLVTEFWNLLTQYLMSGHIVKAFWVGFSVEQLCTLASEKFHPLDFSTCVLRKRIPFLQESGEPGGAPSHGNYVTSLGCNRALFDKLFAYKGKVSHGLLAV